MHFYGPYCTWTTNLLTDINRSLKNHRNKYFPLKVLNFSFETKHIYKLSQNNTLSENKIFSGPKFMNDIILGNQFVHQGSS